MSWVLVHFLVYFLFPTLLRWLLVYKGKVMFRNQSSKELCTPKSTDQSFMVFGKTPELMRAFSPLSHVLVHDIPSQAVTLVHRHYRVQKSTRCSLLCDLLLKYKVNCPPFTVSLRFWVELVDACNSIPLHIQCKTSYRSATWMNDWKHKDGILCRVSCPWWLKKYHLIVKY